MLIFDRSQKQWFLVTTGLLVLAALLYVLSDHPLPHGPYASTGPGLWFGVLGTTAMVFAALLAGRKKLMRYRLGSLRWWLKGHIWLGALSVPLLLFHADFRWGGTLETLLWIVFAVVIASGFVGLAAQNVIPRLMKVELPSEAIQEQITHRCDALRGEADRLVHSHCQVLAQQESESRRATATSLNSFYHDVVRPYLAVTYYAQSELHHASRSEGLFADFRRPLPSTDRDVVTRLEDLCRQRRNLDLQSRLFYWLHGWLLIHVPLSFALLVLVLLHIGTALYY